MQKLTMTLPFFLVLGALSCPFNLVASILWKSDQQLPFADGLLHLLLLLTLQPVPFSVPKAARASSKRPLKRGNAFEVIGLQSHICRGLQLTLTPS